LVGVDVQGIRGKRQGYRGGDGVPVRDSGSQGKSGFCYLQFNMYSECPDLMRRNGGMLEGCERGRQKQKSPGLFLPGR